MIAVRNSSKVGKALPYKGGVCLLASR